MLFHDNILPDNKGFFGEFGGQFVPEELKRIMDEINNAYEEISRSQTFQDELSSLYTHYVGRPSPLYYAENLSNKLGGARIYLKREDLNHTGAHKINHCLGEALLAKHMGKKKILAETGAGQHGVALSAAAALVGIECEIHMGEVDIKKEHPNVIRMKILGSEVVPVTSGTRSLKDAVDSAFNAYLQEPENLFYAIGSVVGPHPFPKMVRDFQSIVGKETKRQFLAMEKTLPDKIIACVGGGSNAIGIFTEFLNDKEVELIGVEPAGEGLTTGKHAATLTLGTKGIIHGFKCYNLQDQKGNPLPVYSVASGLVYPGVGPQHSYLKDLGRVKYVTASDEETLNAFMLLSRSEGIIPALESSHAVAYAVKIAPELSSKENIIINLSGRGDKDIDYVAERLAL